MKKPLYTNKAKYNEIAELIVKQRDMLKDKDEALLELYAICDTNEKKSLVKKLILDFTEMDEDVYNLCLQDMASYIIRKQYPVDKCLVLAMCHDHFADSSQAVIQDIKLPLGIKGFPVNNFCNRFDRFAKKEFSSFKHVFVVDDFVGSGKTIINRYNEFTKKYPNVTIDFVIAAGMKYAINKIQELGINIYCTYPLNKGISENFRSDEVSDKLVLMTEIEQSLSPTINEKSLSDFHLGYGQSEALFTRKKKNIPNNVFPIFWWKNDKNGNTRKLLFDRVEEGY